MHFYGANIKASQKWDTGGDEVINTRKFKAAMVEAGYTQATLAKAVGMNTRTLNAKINGKSKMFVEEACIFCELLNIVGDKKKVSIFLSDKSQ